MHFGKILLGVVGIGAGVFVGMWAWKKWGSPAAAAPSSPAK